MKIEKCVNAHLTDSLLANICSKMFQILFQKISHYRQMLPHDMPIIILLARTKE